MAEDLRDAALAYHRFPKPGKLEISATKPLANQRDLALAYSPGVAAACLAIAEDPGEASSLTARANLVAVVTNGTAVLGLGNIGPLASTVLNRSSSIKSARPITPHITRQSPSSLTAIATHWSSPSHRYMP